MWSLNLQNPMVLLSTLITLTPCLTSAFYIPGMAPTSYAPGDRVPLYVNNLTPGSSRRETQLQSIFSFEYYYPLFQFCEPEGGAKSEGESLGSILFGDRIKTSPYELHMKQNETCKLLCANNTIYEDEVAMFVNAMIQENYNLNWLVDGLPAAQVFTDGGTGDEFYSPGFKLGRVEGQQTFLHNHYEIKIEYHELSPKKMRVVGVLVNPSSRGDSRAIDGGKAECGNTRTPLILSEFASTTVTYTYDVLWIASDTAFATRWDKYLHVYDPRVHWVSLISSTILVIFLSILVASILLRALRKDIARYNRLDSFALDDFSPNITDPFEDSVQEDSGWKLIHGDVFRPPPHPLALSIILGAGAQLFSMLLLTLTFALLGLLSPSYRGSLGTALIILYILLSSVGGYTSSRFYASFNGSAFRTNALLTPVLFPSFVFLTGFLINLYLWSQSSSGAVPLTTMLLIIVLWFLVSLPLSLVGSYLSLLHPMAPPPCRTNQIPRQIPPSATYLRPLPSMLLAGALPFGAIFVELYFIMRSIWFSKVYYMFGFLFVCYGLMVLTCACVTVLTVYFVLCGEDYRWHWRAVQTGGGVAAFVVLNGVWFWVGNLRTGGVGASVVYLGYLGLVGVGVWILTGSIGFLASWVFVHRIYASIKVD